MSQELLYWQALNRAMDAEMEADESVFTLGEDVGLYGGSYRVTEGLFAKYGEWRVRDTPISENSFTGLASARRSYRHAAGSRDHDHQFRTAGLGSHRQRRSKNSLHVGGTVSDAVCRRVYPGGLPGNSALDYAQRFERRRHERSGFARCRTIDAAGCLLAIRQAIASDGPIILLEHELLYFSKGSVDLLADPPPMHRAALRRKGRDLTIVSYSRPALLVQEAATALAERGYRGGGHRSAQP